jgi:hypothetical protein
MNARLTKKVKAAKMDKKIKSAFTPTTKVVQHKKVVKLVKPVEQKVEEKGDK